ncbi:MAG: YfiR family protein [Myxococcota bacterium]
MSFVVALIMAISLTGAPSGPDVKSELVRRLTHYVTWPASSNPPEQFVICVMADPEMRRALDAMVSRAKELRDAPCRLEVLEDGDDIAGCHLAWLGKAALPRASELRRRARATGSLLVSGEPASCRKGAHFSLIQRESGFTVQIDRAGTQADGFSVSSKLHRVAEDCP